MSRNRNYLFISTDSYSVKENQKNQLISAIKSKNENELLNTPEDDLKNYYAGLYEVNIPSLIEENIVVDERETQIDARYDFGRFITDTSKPFYVTGVSIDVEIPFNWDSWVFQIRPSQYYMNPIESEIRNWRIYFSIAWEKLEPEKVKSEINKRVADIKQYLNWLDNDFRSFSDELRNLAKTHIQMRKNKILENKSLVSSLGFKLKEREGMPKTYSSPSVKRKILPQEPKASSDEFKPEPTLSQQDYKHILEVCNNMAIVMEKSPSAFVWMKEENLRSHFLVQLNGHFEWNATGETFNYEWKTDILIKDKWKNIFIAECKFWKWDKAYLETIDQLLWYLSWRDSKAAIFVFNRNKELSSVLDRIEEITSTHSNYKKLVKKNSETSWEYIFSHKDDNSREIIITIQVYDIPINP